MQSADRDSLLPLPVCRLPKFAFFHARTGRAFPAAPRSGKRCRNSKAKYAPGDAMSADPEVLARLDAILSILATLPRDIANAGRKGSALRREDREALAHLLPRISHEIGSTVFTVREALDTPGLSPAIETATGGPISVKAGRTLGKLFARADGFEIDGHLIERTGEVRDGVLWRVSR